MAIYSKVSGIGASSIKGVDGISITNIRAINASLSSAFALLLDERYGFGAEAAYSVRRLSGLYNGPLLVVRRDSDDATLEVGFTSSNDLDVSAIETFCGTANGYVTEWRDQSGNLNHAAQSVETSQPKIYDSVTGVVKENGRVALDFDGTSDSLKYSGNFFGGSAASGFSVSSFDNATRAAREIIYGLQDTTGARYDFLLTRQASNTPAGTTQNGIDFYIEGDFEKGLHTITDANQHLLSAVYSNTVKRDVFDNGVLAHSYSDYNLGTLTDGTDFVIGEDINGSNNIDGKVQEIITYNSDKSTDRTQIESNIADYFTQNTPLLDTYTGAAASYSLRKLSSSYSGPLVRVREDGTDTQADIYANVFGELDTIALANHCGSNNGLVVGWYDQSGNLNNATQSALTAQPKIYDGVTGVVTENGKPTVQFDGSGELGISSYPFTGTDLYIGAVARYTDTITEANLYSFGNASTIYALGFNRSAASTYGATRFTGTHQAQGDSYNQTQSLFSQLYESSTTSAYLDGVQGTQSYNCRANYNGSFIGSRNGVYFLNGNVQEIVIYDSDQSTNRTGIEDNINTFYGIYDTGLIGEYSGAAAAYSLRSLSSVYDGAAITVRRDSDDSTKNIYFDSNGNLDTAALTGFCGNNNGYIVRWFDQSGNSNHATQPSDTAQPKIYDSVTGVITENGKPAPTYNGHRLDIGYQNTSASNYSFFTVSKNSKSTGSFMITSETPLLVIDGRGQGSYFESAWRGNGSTTTTQILQSFLLVSNSSGAHYQNGSAISTGLTYTQRTFSGARVIGDSYVGSKPVVGVIQEVIIWPSDQSSNRTGIEANINNNYLIYQPDTAPTSGLLASYPGAAAAYSLRQLSNEAVIAVTVRRDSDDNVSPIGFDGRELDTEALAAWCGNSNGYVTTWWDQSTLGNHATSPSLTTQPLIYDGNTGVVTENGKPAVQFDGSSATRLSYTDSYSGTKADFSIYSVARHNGVPTDTKRTYWAEGTAMVWGPSTRSFPNPTVNINMTQAVNGAQELRGASFTLSPANYVGSINGAIDVSGTGTWTSITRSNSGNIGSRGNGSWSLNGNIQEIILYQSDQSANRTGIETNILEFYTQYILDQYSGAAAAYSLRALSSTATNAVQVRRDSDDATQYIGFVRDGFSLSLDTSALSTFCGSANGYVSEWVDQSGNSNNATQPALTAQRKIYDSSTGVVTYNGKPAAFITGVNGGMYVHNIPSGTTWTSFATFKTSVVSGFGVHSRAPFSPWWYLGESGSANTFVAGFANVSLYKNNAQLTISTRGALSSDVGTDHQTITAFGDLTESGSNQWHLWSAYGTSYYNLQGYVQEAIIYASDQSANRTNIEDNINGYYDIY